MPLYKEQGIVLRAVKLGEADKIVTILTQGSGKVRGVAKGIRRTTSKFGKAWSHPVIADGRLHLRDHEFIFCYDVKK